MIEFWNRLDEILTHRIFSIGDQAVTVSGLITFALLLIASFVVASLAEKMLRRYLFRRYAIGKGLDVAIGRLIKYVIIGIGVLISFQTIGVKMESITVIFGFLSVGIGFGLQNLTSNFISGILLLMERPVKVGDRISVDGIVGDVQDIHIRATVVRTLENVSIIVPNSKFIEANVTNWSYGDDLLRVRVDVGVAYGSDVKKVRDILLRVAAENNAVLRQPEARALFMAFGESSLDFSLFAYIGDLRNRYAVESDLRFAIDAAFREEEVEIPFPQRDLHLRDIPAGLAEGKPEKA